MSAKMNGRSIPDKNPAVNYTALRQTRLRYPIVEFQISHEAFCLLQLCTLLSARLNAVA